MSNGNLLNVIRCQRTRVVMRAALDAGWKWIGYTKSGHVEIQWPRTGALLHCATTPSDSNAWKRFAAEIYKVSGVDLRPKGNRRRSRKACGPSGFSIDRAVRDQVRNDVEGGFTSETPDSRPPMRSLAEEDRARRLRAAAAQRERDAAAIRVVDAERRRRDIEDLMQPGYGR